MPEQLEPEAREMPETTVTDRNTSICSFARLASTLARKYSHWSLSRSDLTQEAMVAAMIAVDQFNPTAGTTLAQYVACRMAWACADAVKKARSDTRLREDADLSTLTSN
jgi:DNA-directed RNA polymerase sigma subunit (sigma70/sigma32)